MKQIFTLFIASFLIVFVSYSQCSTDFDWGEITFGVNPDPAVGESFVDGSLEMPYAEEIHILVPTNASDILDNIDLDIDSVRLDSIVLTQDGLFYSLEDLGLELTCNNDGTLNNPCAFLAGQTGCGVISGTPLLSGTFEATVHSTIFVQFFGPVNFPFEGYTLFVDDPTNIHEISEPVEDLRVTPNPFSTKALVELKSAQAGIAEFKIYTLLGEEKFAEKIRLSVGHNKFKISSNDLESGVYLYHVKVGEFRVTKRLVVNK